MKAYIALGSNLGDPELNLQVALGHIEATAGKIVAASSFYHSEPQGFVSENNFVNAVVLIDTDLSPIALLESLQAIERMMGRKEKTKDASYQDRLIDLDILMYEGVTMDHPELKIPHPRMRERDFVMKPLSELPGLG
jgi:2-amino-4-hydroxy-6-hydroxymethyldihydropteridine diphosphokinase